MNSTSKRLTSLLSAAILFCFIALPSHAATSESLAPRGGTPDATAFVCKKCYDKDGKTITGDIKETWVEYNYYGNFMWYRILCPVCNYTWYYSYQMNAMHDPESPDTEADTVQESSPEALVVK